MSKRFYTLLIVLAIDLISGLPAQAQETPPNTLHREAAKLKKAENADTVGYLLVSGTDIRTPIVQGPGEDKTSFICVATTKKSLIYLALILRVTVALSMKSLAAILLFMQIVIRLT